MRHSIAIAILAAYAALTAPAVASDANKSATQLDSSTTASTGPNADLGTVMSAIEASRSTATAIQAMTAVGSVQVVKLSDIVSGSDKQALDKAVVENEADITGVQAAIMANSELKRQVDAQTVDTSAIVAASIGDDGAVTVFVR